MKSLLSKSEAKNQIDSFFQRPAWSVEELKKIKQLAMKYRIRLGEYRKRFCKKCLLPLSGSLRVTKTHKTVVCEHCQFKNRIRISP